MTANDAPAEGSLAFEVELDAPVEQVWRALTEPELLAAWLAPEQVGPEHAGPIDWEPIEAEPGRSVRYAWRGEGEAGLLDTEVLFEVRPTEAGGSRLVITHSGFAPARADEVVSLADHRARRRPAMIAQHGALQWAA